MTRQRQVILEELKALKSHPTADELYHLVRRRLPHISLGTVYRNLELLAGLGAIRKLRPGGLQGRFDGDVDRHYHVRCVRCGRVDDVPIKPLRAVENVFRRVPQYQVFDYTLEFTGVCAQCVKRKRNRLKARSAGAASAPQASAEGDRVLK